MRKFAKILAGRRASAGNHGQHTSMLTAVMLALAALLLLPTHDLLAGKKDDKLSAVDIDVVTDENVPVTVDVVTPNLDQDDDEDEDDDDDHDGDDHEDEDDDDGDDHDGKKGNHDDKKAQS